MQSSNLLLYPSITVCSTSYDVMRYVSDGKCFESEQAYITFHETNVITPYTLASGPPNISEFLHSINTFDTNGTMHVMSPMTNDGQNRYVHKLINWYFYERAKPALINGS